jgi:hypothetical protein
MHIGDIGCATAEQCRTQRRVRRDATLTYISFTRSDQFVCLLFPVAMMDSNAASDNNTAIRLHNLTLTHEAPEGFQAASGELQLSCGQHGGCLSITYDTVLMRCCLKRRQVTDKSVRFRLEATQYVDCHRNAAHAQRGVVGCVFGFHWVSTSAQEASSYEQQHGPPAAQPSQQ